MKHSISFISPRRLLVAFLTFIIGVTSVAPASAAIPVLDAAVVTESSFILVEGTITAAQQTLSTVQDFYEWAESFSLADLKGTLTGALQDKIMGFIKGAGANGGPAFITDWQAYLQSVRTTAEADTLSEIGQTDICDDFRTPLLSAVGATNQASNPTKQNALSCDFPDGKLTEIAIDPSKGSWADYEKSFKPQNNFYGSYFIAQNAIQKETEEREKAATNEALAGEGFLSAKNNGLITTPGSVLKDLTSKAAGSDFDLIANADQLKDIIGMVSGGLISELTSGGGSSGSKGISGVDLAARRARRNRSRDASGERIAQDKLRPNCVQVFLDSNYLSTDDFKLFDTNGSGDLSELEIDNGIKKAVVADIDYTLFDLCTDSADAQTGNNQKKASATIAEVLVKRRKAKEKLAELEQKFDRTIRNLNKYPDAEVKGYYKIDNPSFNPSSSVKADLYRYAYVRNDDFSQGTKGVNPKICFELDPATKYKVEPKTDTLKKHVEIAFKYVDYVSDPTNPFDPNNPAVFNPNATKTNNPGVNGKRPRCTVNLRGMNLQGEASKGDLIEVAYYKKQKKAIDDIIAANNLALKKLEALNDMIKAATKTGQVVLRNKKVAAIVSDFNCHGDPFQCLIDDVNNSSLNKRLGCDNDDADPTSGESGYFDADNSCSLITDSLGNAQWLRTPGHRVIPSSELAGRILALTAFDNDTYRDILNKIGITSASAAATASQTAIDGMITNINNDPNDDPSNPYYDPAFDPEEANRVFGYSNGNLAILGDFTAISDADDADSELGDGDPNQDDTDSLPE